MDLFKSFSYKDRSIWSPTESIIQRNGHSKELKSRPINVQFTKYQTFMIHKMKYLTELYLASAVSLHVERGHLKHAKLKLRISTLFLFNKSIKSLIWRCFTFSYNKCLRKVLVLLENRHLRMILRMVPKCRRHIF